MEAYNGACDSDGCHYQQVNVARRLIICLRVPIFFSQFLYPTLLLGVRSSLLL